MCVCVCVCIVFQILFPYKLLQNMSTVPYAIQYILVFFYILYTVVVPCCFFILYTAVCMC